MKFSHSLTAAMMLKQVLNLLSPGLFVEAPWHLNFFKEERWFPDLDFWILSLKRNRCWWRVAGSQHEMKKTSSDFFPCSSTSHLLMARS